MTTKISIFYNVVTKKPDNNNLFVLVSLRKSVYSCKNKLANTKNKNYRQDETYSYICASKH